MKKLLILLIFIPLLGCSQWRPRITSVKPKTTTTKTPILSNIDISAGLKEALNNGISKQVSLLTVVDGFYKNAAVKIMMPPETQKVETMLRRIGFGSLADDGIRSLNRAAEDAVKTATPIFVSAIKNMSFADAKSILIGSPDAATLFLQRATNDNLYQKFSPIVQQSIGRVGADVAWNRIISKYNAIPLMGKVNPDLTDYVTRKALDGVFKMIAVEEKNIRTKLESRTTTLLQQVFGMQGIAPGIIK